MGILLPYLVDVLAFIPENFLAISIGGDFLLLVSLVVLGGDYWDKLRGLFNRNAKIYIPSNIEK